MTTPTLGDLTQIPVTKNPTQGLPSLGPGAMVTLYNQDITNLVYISYQQWFTPGLGNSVPIQPLTSITISAQKAIYVAALVTGVANLLVLPEGSQAQPSPAQIATQISTLGLAKDTSVNAPAYGPSTQAGLTTINGTLGAPAQDSIRTAIPNNIATTGVPLLVLPSNLVNSTNQVVASGATTVLGPFNFNQVGYEITVSAHSAGVTPTYCRIVMTWIDSVTGTTLNRQSWWWIPGSDATTNQHTIKGYGPTEGNQVSLTLYAFNNSVTFDQVIMNQNSRIYTRHDWRTFAMAALAGGLAASTFDMSGMYLMNNAVSLATGTHFTVYPPLFAGRIQLWGNSASNAADCVVQVNPIADQIVTTQTSMNLTTGSDGNVNIPYVLPRSQQQVVVTNNNAATKTCRLAMIMSDS